MLSWASSHRHQMENQKKPFRLWRRGFFCAYCPARAFSGPGSNSLRKEPFPGTVPHKPILNPHQSQTNPRAIPLTVWVLCGFDVGYVWVWSGFMRERTRRRQGAACCAGSYGVIQGGLFSGASRAPLNTTPWRYSHFQTPILVSHFKPCPSQHR